MTTQDAGRQASDKQSKGGQSKGVDFTTSNQEAVFSMLKYWCREKARGRADVEAVTQKEDRFLVTGNKDFLTALQSAL